MQSARGATAGAGQLRAQNALVVTQVALALVLLVASGLMVRTFLALRAVAPGFTQPERIQTVRLSIPEALTPEPERVVRMQAQILERLAALPGVTAAGFASGLPMELEYRNGLGVAVEGKTPLDQVAPNRVIKNISPGLLAAQGTRLVAGRDFTWEDVFGQRQVAACLGEPGSRDLGSAGQRAGQADSDWSRRAVDRGRRRRGRRLRGRRAQAGTRDRLLARGSGAAGPAGRVRGGPAEYDVCDSKRACRHAGVSSGRHRGRSTPSIPICRWPGCERSAMSTDSPSRAHPSRSFCSALPARWRWRSRSSVSTASWPTRWPSGAAR